MQAWFEEQREKLQRAASAGEPNNASGKVFEDLARTWLALGQGMWVGLEQVSSALSSGGPPLGWAREHEQAWRDLAAAQAEYQRLEGDLLALIAHIQSDALELLERTVRERAGGDRAITGVRELYDLWIECGEQVYAKAAHGERFCQLQATFANAAAQLRARQQALIERGLKYFDLPTRTEINTVHRQMRELRERVQILETHSGNARNPSASKPKRKPNASAKRAAARRSARGTRK